MKRIATLVIVIMILLGACTAVFGAAKNTIKYNANGGKGTMTQTSVKSGASAKLRANSFKKAGYTFAGWSKSKSGKAQYKNKASVKTKKNITLYAVWTANTYTVSYSANGGSGSMQKSKATYGTALRLNANTFTKTGYTFHSWSESPKGTAAYSNRQTVKNLTSKDKDNVTLYARWNPNTYKIKFEANGGKGSMEAGTYTYDQKEELPEHGFVRTGYEFQGWNTKADGNGTSFKELAQVKNLTEKNNGTVALYAQWKKLSNDAASVGAAKDLARYLVKENRKSDLSKGGFTWDAERKTRSWTYYNGMFMHSLMRLDSGKYRDYVEQFYDDNLSEDGTPVKFITGELDSMAGGMGLFDILTKDNNKYSKAVQYLYTHLENQVYFSECGGNFTHKQNPDKTAKKNWETYRIGLDGLYMGTVFLLNCAKAIDEGKLTLVDSDGNEVTSAELYEASYERLAWVGHTMFDNNSGLINHGWDPMRNKGNGCFWTRGSGWYVVALTEAMDMIPNGSYVRELEKIAGKIFNGMEEYLDNGMWRNVTNRGAELSGNKLETSGSACFAYSMMRAANKKHVSGKYYAMGKSVYNKIVSEKLDGTELNDILKASGVYENDAQYMLEGYVTNEAKGVAPFFLAASEIAH
ncbi:MAG: InlB B-repeat-containing protein [Eubacterium sp.]|nr:InlB B-repeat-containing protein [Eubacterium sp.]